MASFNTEDFNLAWAKFQFRTGGKQRKRVWAKLARLIENGVRIDAALSTMRDRREKMKSATDPVVMAMTSWMAELRNGRKLSDAIHDWVNAEESMLIAAGEQSGTIEKALHAAVDLIESRSKIQSTVIGGMLYPFVLMMTTFGVLWLFAVKIIPGFSRIVPDDRWTGLAAQMVQASHLVHDWLWLALLLVAALIVTFLWSLPRWDNDVRVIVDRYPPYSIYRLVQGSIWMIAFSALVDSGIRAESALELLSSRANRWLRSRIQACIGEMRQGHNVGESLARTGYQFPDQEIIDDLGVYSAMSGFEDALGILGRDMLNDTIDALKVRMAIVFNIGLAVMALVISTMVSGLFAMQMQMGQILQSAAR